MNLLSLPPEIRKRIWRLLLTRPCLININDEADRPKPRDDSFEHTCNFREYHNFYDYHRTRHGAVMGWRCSAPRLFTQILRVCKDIFHESITVLYSENEFMLMGSWSHLLSETNFGLIRFVHFHFPMALDSKDRIEYLTMISQVQLNVEVRLIFTFVSRDGDCSNFKKISRYLECIGPVRSCSVRISAPDIERELYETTHSDLLDTAHQLAKSVRLQTTPASSFNPFTQLPKELQLEILSYTDLVQDFPIDRYRQKFGLWCCGKCCHTKSVCCCWGVAFSLECCCPRSPVSLLQVSREFRRDALEIAFSQSFFRLNGTLNSSLKFLRTVEPFLPTVRHMSLRLDTNELNALAAGRTVLWDVLIIYLRAHSKPSHLSLTLFSELDSDIYDTDYPEIFVENSRKAYKYTLSGLKMLAERGLKRFSTYIDNFTIAEDDSYVKAVMGNDYVGSRPQLSIDNLW